MYRENRDRVVILVSVNCITYNHEKYISDAIESFLMQKTNFKYEILIGEDCSTDQTKKIIEDYMRTNPDRIRLITSKQNVGGRKNAMRLQGESIGKYIALCEGDDYWIDPYKLQKQVDYMEANPDCTLCFHAGGIIHGPNNRVKSIDRPYSQDQISPVADIIMGGGGFCPTASLVYPKKLMDSPPEFYVNAPIGDYPMQMYLASLGYAYYFNEKMSIYRRGVVGSWTNRTSYGKQVRVNIIELNTGIIRMLKGFNIFTNHTFNSAVEKVLMKLEFENDLLLKKKRKQRNLAYAKFSLLFRLKIRLKIIVRCHFPRLFFKLSNLNLLKLDKAFKNEESTPVD